jgi:hypothetical protein
VRVTFILAILALPIGAVAAQESKAVVVTPDATQWGPAPAILPPGAKLAVLDGDPTKPDFLQCGSQCRTATAYLRTFIPRTSTSP